MAPDRPIDRQTNLGGFWFAGAPPTAADAGVFSSGLNFSFATTARHGRQLVFETTRSRARFAGPWRPRHGKTQSTGVNHPPLSFFARSAPTNRAAPHEASFTRPSSWLYVRQQHCRQSPSKIRRPHL